ncbi:hypothetical protein QFC19_004826 [Naganishia cerealis]|uniref:Uncharacterized protein n=1 Tax=Naganishia cerealis TaxID=610337 RepID=A0ACC2VS68_9TREE|nr:hypothetical protein QFC19_004826 [Naganishia cerealis]
MASTAAAKVPTTGGTRGSYSRFKSPAVPSTTAPVKKAVKSTTTSVSPAAAVAQGSVNATGNDSPFLDVANGPDPSFPIPQPSAQLPDYAALAPPLDLPPPSKKSAYSVYLADSPGFDSPAESVSWATSFHGLSAKPYEKEVAQVLMRPLSVKDIEIKPGRISLASVARGEQEYFSPDGVPTAIEASKSNALMRCCKDLGIASELWDPTFIKEFKKKYCVDVMVEHVTSKKKRKLWRKKEDKFEYPYKEL